MIPVPIKPFPSYKWRWLSTMPTENLLDPPLFLGVLRVLARHENMSPSNPKIADELAIVQKDTQTPVDLVRTPERNLIRNSGQYWKGTGLLLPEHGAIRLTDLGHKVAQGAITQSEFAALMVQQTVLPNPWTCSKVEFAEWRNAGLEIHPFLLILEILNELGFLSRDKAEAYITPLELIRVIIPLAGSKTNAPLIASAILEHRKGKLDVSAWPDCIPKQNDHRLAKEFLRFLANFDLCSHIERDNSNHDRYQLDEYIDIDTIANPITQSVFTNNVDADIIIDHIRHSPLPSIIERHRTTTTVLARSGQSRFRNSVLKASIGRCLLTGEVIPEILEAAHIIPVENGGSDETANGICLRKDIHGLFDAGHIRLTPAGELIFTKPVMDSENYKTLPRIISIPNFVNPHNVDWRYNYLW